MSTNTKTTAYYFPAIYFTKGSTPLSKKLFDQGVRIPLRKETRVGRTKQLIETEVEIRDEMEDEE
ncbi:hypothetical protein BGZ79_008693 [Entomortierella chlamydospora]|nr:hypothetical protein BGZ79_008693 [Entomortierella chlamydospora]